MNLFGPKLNSAELHEKGLRFEHHRSDELLTSKELLHMLRDPKLAEHNQDHVCDALLWSVVFIGQPEEGEFLQAIRAVQERDSGEYSGERAGEILQDFEYLAGKVANIDTLLGVMNDLETDRPNDETCSSAEFYLKAWVRSGRGDIHPYKDAVLAALEKRNELDIVESGVAASKYISD